MGRAWIRDQAPTWDADKARIVGGAPGGIFELGEQVLGQPVAGEWWRAEVDGQVAGFGWMDVVWGDGEISLAVAPEHQGRGLGGWILDQLEAEAGARGLRYVYNVVRRSHPQRDSVGAWLQTQGFASGEHGRRLQRQVRSSSGRPSTDSR